MVNSLCRASVYTRYDGKVLSFFVGVPRIHIGQTFVMSQNASNLRARQEPVNDKHLETVEYFVATST